MDEWVEVKAPTVEEAVKYGMESLEIENRDHVDVEVLKEPEKGFLGIGRSDAIVKVKPRPKPKRRRSRNRRGRGGSGKAEGDTQRGGQQQKSQRGGQKGGDNRGKTADGGGGSRGGNRSGGRSNDRQQGGSGGRGRNSGGRQGGDKRQSEKPKERAPRQERRQETNEEATVVDSNEQAEVIGAFLEGLLDSFGLEGSVETRVDDDVVYADITGEQTEALIGQKAVILQAIHELAKTVVQRKTMSGTRLRLDINGYAERRREALTIYAGRLAEQVIEDNEEVMLEPMNPADRKTVHDAVSEIDGVRSYSEGEDPRRSVVISPTD